MDLAALVRDEIQRWQCTYPHELWGRGDGEGNERVGKETLRDARGVQLSFYRTAADVSVSTAARVFPLVGVTRGGA